jgi:hypothetical protein
MKTDPVQGVAARRDPSIRAGSFHPGAVRRKVL